MSLESRRALPPFLLTRIASFTAVGLVAGLALSAIPNVELVTATCFMSGFLLGAVGGAMTGALTETLFAGFHPMGSTLGPVLIAQVAGMIIAGLAGALVARFVGTARRGWHFRGTILLFGVCATLIFDILTNLAFPFMAGFSFSQGLAVMAAGIPFAIIHIGSNALVFLLVVGPLLPRLEKALVIS
jgi:hypothetical protein